MEHWITSAHKPEDSSFFSRFLFCVFRRRETDTPPLSLSLSPKKIWESATEVRQATMYEYVCSHFFAEMSDTWISAPPTLIEKEIGFPYKTQRFSDISECQCFQRAVDSTSSNDELYMNQNWTYALPKLIVNRIAFALQTQNLSWLLSWSIWQRSIDSSYYDSCIDETWICALQRILKHESLLITLKLFHAFTDKA